MFWCEFKILRNSRNISRSGAKWKLVRYSSRYFRDESQSVSREFQAQCVNILQPCAQHQLHLYLHEIFHVSVSEESNFIIFHKDEWKSQTDLCQNWEQYRSSLNRLYHIQMYIAHFEPSLISCSSPSHFRMSRESEYSSQLYRNSLRAVTVAK